MFKIYILKDPRYFQPKYVGQTSNLKIRYMNHLTPSSLKSITHKTNWIKSLLKENIKPEIDVIEEVLTHQEAKEREIYWIAYLKNIGYKLTNGTNGGEGTSNYRQSQQGNKNKLGFKLSEESKFKMRKPKSEMHKLKISLSLNGNKLSEATKLKMSESRKGNKNRLGVKCSEETRLKMSEAHKKIRQA